MQMGNISEYYGRGPNGKMSFDCGLLFTNKNFDNVYVQCPKVLKYLTNQSVYHCKKSISSFPDSCKYIRNFTMELIKQIVSNNYENMRHINISNINFLVSLMINNDNINIFKLFDNLPFNAKNCIYDKILTVTNSVEVMQLYGQLVFKNYMCFILNNPLNLEHIKNPTRKICREAAIRNPYCLKMIPSEYKDGEFYKYFIDNSSLSKIVNFVPDEYLPDEYKYIKLLVKNLEKNIHLVPLIVITQEFVNKLIEYYSSRFIEYVNRAIKNMDSLETLCSIPFQDEDIRNDTVCKLNLIKDLCQNYVFPKKTNIVNDTEVINYLETHFNITVECVGNICKYVLMNYLQTPELVNYIMTVDGMALEYVNVQTRENIMIAMNQNINAFKYVQYHMQTYDIVQDALRKNGLLLEHVLVPHTPEIVALAVSQNGLALKYSHIITELIAKLAYVQNTESYGYVWKTYDLPIPELFVSDDINNTMKISPNCNCKYNGYTTIDSGIKIGYF